MAESYLDPSNPPLPSNVDIMISLARIDEKVRGMSDAKRSEHVVMEREMARIDLESRARDAELSVHMNKLDDAVRSVGEAVGNLKLSYAKMSGMAAAVAGVVAAALSAAISYLLR